MKITIPYGNFGQESRTYNAMDSYMAHHLFFDGSFKIAAPGGCILLRNRLNEHLPEITPDTWRRWVDWVLSLNPNTPNQLDGLEFSGRTPMGLIGEINNQPQRVSCADLLPF